MTQQGCYVVLFWALVRYYTIINQEDVMRLKNCVIVLFYLVLIKT